MTNLQDTIDNLDKGSKTILDQDLVSSLLTSEPFKSVPNIFNLRLLTTSSSLIRPGLLYRSGTLHHLKEEDHGKLRNLGIQSVFDLRARYEVEKESTAPIEGIKLNWTEPVIPEDVVASLTSSKGEDEEYTLEKMYRTILISHREPYKKFFEHIRDHPDQPVLFHCFGGKDRTGILAALILKIAGANDQDVIYDYMLTRAGLEPVFVEFRSDPEKHSTLDIIKDPKKATYSETRSETIITCLAYLKEEYRGAEGYLKNTLGFSDADVETIRENIRPKKAGL